VFTARIFLQWCTHHTYLVNRMHVGRFETDLPLRNVRATLAVVGEHFAFFVSTGTFDGASWFRVCGRGIRWTAVCGPVDGVARSIKPKSGWNNITVVTVTRSSSGEFAGRSATRLYTRKYRRISKTVSQRPVTRVRVSKTRLPHLPPPHVLRANVQVGLLT